MTGPANLPEKPAILTQYMIQQISVAMPVSMFTKGIQLQPAKMHMAKPSCLPGPSSSAMPRLWNSAPNGLAVCLFGKSYRFSGSFRKACGWSRPG